MYATQYFIIISHATLWCVVRRSTVSPPVRPSVQPSVQLFIVSPSVRSFSFLCLFYEPFILSLYLNKTTKVYSKNGGRVVALRVDEKSKKIAYFNELSLFWLTTDFIMAYKKKKKTRKLARKHHVQNVLPSFQALSSVTEFWWSEKSCKYSTFPLTFICLIFFGIIVA